MTPICSLNWGAPYGQAHSQYRQPMHLLASTWTMPSSSRFQSAWVGHTWTQSGFSQWLQATEV
jgi:hypothetical protein